MKNIYVSPYDQSKLKLEKNFFRDKKGNEFPLISNIPNFIYPKNLEKDDIDSIAWYKENAEYYDKFLPLTFDTFEVNEGLERKKMINELRLEKNYKVLEIGCGTGRDSELIANELGQDGELYLQDISVEILDVAVKKFQNKKFPPNIMFSLSNAAYLPFPNNVFDRVFHFGGLNTFGDKKRFFNEIIRVIKPGGKIVVGDENMPSWLRETDFGKILMNSNPHYKYDLPLDFLPKEARNVKLEWFIGGVFYFISFDVGQGEPFADLDFEIPGIRGGSHRSRYYGHLEGVSNEAIDLAKKARVKTGKSMHEWLDQVVKTAAKKDLGE